MNTNTSYTYAEAFKLNKNGWTIPTQTMAENIVNGDASVKLEKIHYLFLPHYDEEEAYKPVWVKNETDGEHPDVASVWCLGDYEVYRRSAVFERKRCKLVKYIKD